MFKENSNSTQTFRNTHSNRKLNTASTAHHTCTQCSFTIFT